MRHTAKRLAGQKSEYSVKQYTLGEEIFNAVSHGVGAFLAVIGGSVMVTLSVLFGSGREVAACTIYAITLCIMYTMSTLYHAFPFPKVKRIFRIFDHSSVFLLIAGTYTPFMLITLQGNTKGLIIIAAVWAVTIIGIVLNAINIRRFTKLSLVLYVLMGWSVVLAIGDVAAALPAAGLALLVGGGISYTGGIVFYAIKKVRYFHCVWHLFVLCGSVLHYLCIVLYVLPRPM